MSRPSGFLVADDWIGGLPEKLRAEITSLTTRLAFAAGSEVVRAGASPDAVYRVVSGFLKQTGLQSDGERTLLTVYARGACFAETAVVCGSPMNHTTVALTDAVVDQLPSTAFWNLYRVNPEIPDALCRKFANSIRRQVADRETRAATRLGERVELLFAELARSIGTREPDGRYRVDLPITQFDVAEHFGVARQSVQREVSRLARGGALKRLRSGWLVALTGRTDPPAGRR